MASDIGIDFAAGCVGGAAGVLAGHPLDTVKVRLQTQCANNPTYRGTVHCFTTIAKAEKVQGLYKGVSSPLSSVAFLNAIIFGVHGSVAKSFTEKHALWTHFVAGCAAGSAQAFLASPCELVKLRVQLQPVIQNTPHKTPYQCLRNIIQQHGWKPLTRGLLATQLRDSTGIGVYFAAYEFLARKMSPDGQMESLNSLQLLLAGGLAGTFSWLFNYPVDVIKTRFQADDSYKNYMEVINKMYAERGARTFFVGLGSTLIRAFPTNAATFFTVEWTYRLLIDYNLLGKVFSKVSIGSTTKEENTTGKSPQIQQQRRHYVSVYDLWSRNCFMLPEAGTTLIDPIIHHCRVYAL
ncbi:mitochondrial carrier protein [Ditylenchus destructor]|nr:mitochondrial carrier protein [Ditylenchus destructor]